MARPARPAATRGRSAAAGVWIVFAVGVPLIQWIRTAAFHAPSAAVAGSVWFRFVSMMMAGGILAAALMYVAARSPRGWARSGLIAVVLAMALGADVQELGRLTPASFAARWLVASLATGLLLAPVVHLFGRVNQSR